MCAPHAASLPHWQELGAEWRLLTGVGLCALLCHLGASGGYQLGVACGPAYVAQRHRVHPNSERNMSVVLGGLSVSPNSAGDICRAYWAVLTGLLMWLSAFTNTHSQRTCVC